MKTKSKKSLMILLSLSLTVFSLAFLLFIFKIINSREINKVFEFQDPATIQNGIILSGGKAYLYNNYGGDFLTSDIFSLPLSQYENDFGNFEYCLFDGKFHGINYKDAQFNSANTTKSFIYKNDRELYLYNTEDFSVKTILHGNNIISCSKSGTYFLEQDGSSYYFHKLKSPDFDFYSPVKLNIESDVCIFHFWINDSYALFSSITEKGKLYFIANAENGETAPAYSIHNTFEEWHKELISERFFINNKSKNNIECFNIYLQESSNFKFDNAKNSNVLAISHNSSYAVIESKNETFIVSKNGKLKSLSELLGDECVDAHFLLDNIVILTTKSNSQVYKLMF